MSTPLTPSKRPLADDETTPPTTTKRRSAGRQEAGSSPRGEGGGEGEGVSGGQEPRSLGGSFECAASREHEPAEEETALACAGDSLSSEDRVAAVALTPGRNLETLPGRVVGNWGACYRCGIEGHFAANCPLESRVFPAQWPDRCSGCHAEIPASTLITKYGGGGWAHPRCAVGFTKMKVEKERRAITSSSSTRTEQETVVDFVVGGEGHGLVTAAAGSGKTRVLVECYKKCSRAIVLVYNKAAQLELADRGCEDALTFHSLGRSAWQEHLGEHLGGLIKHKSTLLLHAICPPTTHDLKKKRLMSLECVLFKGFVKELVSHAKTRCVGCAQTPISEELKKIAKARGLFRGLERTQDFIRGKERKEEAFKRWPSADALNKRGVSLAAEVLKASSEVARGSWRGLTYLRSVNSKKDYDFPLLDFDDLLYMPLLDRVRLYEGPLDFVFVDEAQDSNAARREICARLVAETTGCRMLAVGDPMQAIYGFGGADSDSLSQLDERFEKALQKFKLRTCHRCPRSHVDLANAVITDLEEEDLEVMTCRPGAPVGRVVRGATFTSEPLPGDRSLGALLPMNSGKRKTVGVVCRMNAPLLALRSLLTRRGIACRMIGLAALSTKMKKLVQSVEAGTVSDLKLALSSGHYHFQDEEQEDDDDDEEEDAGEEKKGKTSAFDAKDAATSLVVLCEALEHEQCDDIIVLLGRLGEMFGEGDGAGDEGANLTPDERSVEVTTLATVHRAKGLEWDTVHILEPALLPLECILEGGGWEARQEHNVEYVALTRARSDLIYLRDVNQDEDEGGRPIPWRTAVEALFQSPPPPAFRKKPPRAKNRDDWSSFWRGFAQEERKDEEPSRPSSAPTTTASLLRDLGLDAMPGSPAELKAAYWARLLVVHPDRQARSRDPLDEKTATALTRKAIFAYETIKAGEIDDGDEESDGEEEAGPD